jgi:iron complex outermembrane receptor protein
MKFVILFFLSSFSSFLLAGTADSLSRYEIPGVTIEAQRRAIGLFDGEFVREGELPSGEPADKLLAYCTECFIKDYGPGALSTISIRGLSAGHTKVFWGEMPIENPMLGQSDLSLLAILPGQELRFKGENRNEGTGGELLINTVEPDFDSLRITAYQQLGSFWEMRSGFALQLPVTRWLSTYTAAQRSASENDFSYFNPNWGAGQNRLNRHASFELWSIQQGLFFNIRDRHLLKIEYRGDLANRQLGPLMTEWSSRKAQLDDIHIVKVEAQFDTKVGGISVFTGFNHHRNQYHDSAIALYSDNLSRVLSSGARLSGVSNRFRYGLLFRHDWQQGQSSSYTGDQHGLHANLDLSYQINLQHAALDIIARLKHSTVNGNVSPLSPTIGLDLHSYSSVRWRLRYEFSRQYRFPTLNDLFWDPGGNLELEPEEGWGTELNVGVDIPFPNKGGSIISAFATGYYQRLTDYILWAPDPNGVWFASNLDIVRAYGVEGSLTQQYKFRSCQVRLSSKYAYQRIGNLEGAETGLQHIYAPEHQFTGSIRIGYKDFSFRSDVQYTGRRFTARDHSSALNPFWTLGASITYSLKLPKQQILLFGIYGSNLTDTDFQVMANRPMPGASIRGSISYQFTQNRFPK